MVGLARCGEVEVPAVLDTVEVDGEASAADADGGGAEGEEFAPADPGVRRDMGHGSVERLVGCHVFDEGNYLVVGGNETEIGPARGVPGCSSGDFDATQGMAPGCPQSPFDALVHGHGQDAAAVLDGRGAVTLRSHALENRDGIGLGEVLGGERLEGGYEVDAGDSFHLRRPARGPLMVGGVGGNRDQRCHRSVGSGEPAGNGSQTGLFGPGDALGSFQRGGGALALFAAFEPQHPKAAASGDDPDGPYYVLSVAGCRSSTHAS